MKAITGKTLQGDYRNTQRRSCAYMDYPTGERVSVEIEGREYERTVHERAVWRNQGPNRVVVRFVKVQGINYELA